MSGPPAPTRSRSRWGMWALAVGVVLVVAG